MTAAYSIITPYERVQAFPFAVVADDTTAHYVYQPGEEIDDLNDARLARVLEFIDLAPATAADWLDAATYNIGYFYVDAPVEAPDIAAATTAAQQALAELPPPATDDPAAPASQWRAPQTRDELMAFQRAAADEWSRLYPEAASDDVDNPDADLALVQLMTPPVDPTKPHRWLPFGVAEPSCGFCDQPQDAAIHQAGADTITNGSE